MKKTAILSLMLALIVLVAACGKAELPAEESEIGDEIVQTAQASEELQDYVETFVEKYNENADNLEYSEIVLDEVTFNPSDDEDVCERYLSEEKIITLDKVSMDMCQCLGSVEEVDELLTKQGIGVILAFDESLSEQQAQQILEDLKLDLEQNDGKLSCENVVNGIKYSYSRSDDDLEDKEFNMSFSAEATETD